MYNSLDTPRNEHAPKQHLDHTVTFHSCMCIPFYNWGHLLPGNSWIKLSLLSGDVLSVTLGVFATVRSVVSVVINQTIPINADLQWMTIEETANKEIKQIINGTVS